ncbi:NADH dehydrogenase subunit 5 [Pullulanibacillus sp. KACC 23026]|uniref:NADH dehydrogenase subunit 5 n=1 Tax=Pullulanibacillus sp. KACC 23026 TaxID=3028315 RepID=UPI0023B042FA|nr:NADH dehydrogenase subunit 5 [Pullulanibacillus sp. KACC 23026]WEG12484.1 NADH dehydrogenase subunit 5 [Pullulanibacillus sp. KACC 23026]
MYSLSLSPLLILFFIALILSGLSGLIMLSNHVPLGFVRVHIGINALPPLVAILAFFRASGKEIVGPWHLDSLAWFLACFILSVGLIIQRFSVHYLLGDRSYRKYFTLYTIITGAASMTWLSDDLRLFIVCWGITLFMLTLLIGLNRGWKVRNVAGALSGCLFGVSWLSLLLIIVWLSHVTGTWKLSEVLTNRNLAQLGSMEKTVLNLLLILAVMIPAAQWPFQRWLIESVAAPTPVSAIMHAGLVNAGGIILTRFSPLFDGGVAQIVLLILSTISVLIGTGISMVQVDYKRQLVGSTIAQMGFMLVQCALGAYLAAIIHLVLHGLFKATLFLQSGSAVHPYEGFGSVNKKPSYLSTMFGWVLGLLAGIAYWVMASGNGYGLVNALILGWSLSFSWTQLVAFGKGRIERLAGVALLGGSALVYFMIHHLFYKWLHSTVVDQSVQLPLSVVIFVGCLLILGSLISVLARRFPSSIAFAILYLWLVKLGEGQSKAMEVHPNYLKHYLLREVITHERNVNIT